MSNPPVAGGRINRPRDRLRLPAWPGPDRPLAERNAWHFYADIAWYGVMNGILSAFTSVFAIRLGASDLLVGLLSSLPALVNVAWQIPSARLVERQKRPGPVTVWSLLGFRLIYLLIALMPFVLQRYRAEALVALVIAATLPGALAGVAFTSLFALSVPIERRATVISVRNVLISLAGMLTVLLAGRLLDAIAFPYNYQLFFGIAFAASMFSLYHVAQVQPLQERPLLQRPLPTLRHGPSIPWRQRLAQSWQSVREERNFFNYALGSFACNWGLAFPAALYGLYRVRVLGASDTWIGLLATTESAVQTVMYLVWARQVKQRGSRWVLLTCISGLVAFPLFTGLSTRIEPLLFVAVLGGVFTAGYALANANAILEVSPPARLPIYTAVYGTLANLTAFFGPLLGTVVAGLIGIRYALIACGFLRLTGVLVMSRLPFGAMPTESRTTGGGN